MYILYINCFNLHGYVPSLIGVYTILMGLVRSMIRQRTIYTDVPCRQYLSLFINLFNQFT